jgi:hypothetical protein
MNTIITEPSEIKLNGVDYVRKDSITIPKADHQGEIKIVVLQRGWIYIGRFARKADNTCQLTSAYNIRQWGTKNGLGELVNGKTSTTVLDKINGVVEFDWFTVVHTIAVDQSKWIL